MLTRDRSWPRKRYLDLADFMAVFASFCEGAEEEEEEASHTPCNTHSHDTLIQAHMYYT